MTPKSDSVERLGFSGAVARLFQANAITPLLALVALLLGLFAVLVTPREEEPQINVTIDRKSTRLNSSHIQKSRMPSSA